MSTRLEHLSKLERTHKISATKAREIVITERNKEIFALKQQLRTAHWSVERYKEVLEQIAYGSRHPSYKSLSRAVLAFVETQTDSSPAAPSEGEKNG